MEAVTAPREAPALDSPELFENREVSWLQFNERVLELAEDERVPLLERVKFLAIYANNLDEFFMVRVAGLLDQVEAGIDARGPDGLSARETLERITELNAALGIRHSRAWERDVRPGLAEHGIRVVEIADCAESELRAVDMLFAEQIFPVLTPLAVGPGRPFPYISNLSLSIGVFVRDPVSGMETFARVKVPKEVLPRFVPIGDDTFIPLESVIARHLDELFPGMEMLRHDFFRVSRDADFTVSDEADDLLQAVEDELRRRRFGEVVRLEVSSTMDPDMREYLIEQLAIEEKQVVDVDGLLDLDDLWALTDVDGHRELRYPPWTPEVPPAFAERDDGDVDVLGAIRARRPPRPPPLRLVRRQRGALHPPGVPGPGRARDQDDRVPDLRRLGAGAALIEAAERGKQAVCLVELKARFDERRNIGWARALEEAGAHVVHGLPGLKTHAKAVLVVRREGSGVRHYVHVGTGNYHAKTARLYEDYGLFTCDRQIAADVAELFNTLTGAARTPEYRERGRGAGPHAQLVPGGGRAHDRGEARGQEARIVLKMNSLGGCALHPRPVRGVAGRGPGGPRRARDLLPAAGCAGHLGQHHAWSPWWAASSSTRGSTASSAATSASTGSARRT